MKKHSLVRTIYLYLFALIGLILIVIGTVDFVDMALKTYVFTEADNQERIHDSQPLMAPRKVAQVAALGQVELDGDLELTEEQMKEVEVWLVEYKEWQDKQQKFDAVSSRRHRDASRNLAFMLVGLPLYLYHWSVIKRETKDKKNA